MSFIVVLVIVAAGLFALSFVTRRRFGSLALALAGGALLANLWTSQAAQLVGNAGVKLVAPPLESLVAITLTLAPAVVLATRGAAYRSLRASAIGSALFAVMAVGLILVPLQTALVIDGPGQSVYDTLYRYRNMAVTAGVVYGVADMFLTRPAKPPRSGAKH